MEYKTDDVILPELDLPNPCPIRIVVEDKHVFLYIGPRDWQWERDTGEMVGSGTRLATSEPEPEETIQ